MPFDTVKCLKSFFNIVFRCFRFCILCNYLIPYSSTDTMFRLQPSLRGRVTNNYTTSDIWVAVLLGTLRKLVSLILFAVNYLPFFSMRFNLNGLMIRFWLLVIKVASSILCLSYRCLFLISVSSPHSAPLKSCYVDNWRRVEEVSVWTCFRPEFRVDSKCQTTPGMDAERYDQNASDVHCKASLHL